jgi:hypothetical protein
VGRKEAVNSEEQQQEEEEGGGGCDSQGARRCMLGQVGARWEYGNPFLIGFAACFSSRKWSCH